MSVVGEAALSAFFQILFERLASKHVLDFIRERDMEKVLKKLKTKLLVVKVVLKDAEEKQMKNEAVKMWLDELKDVVHDAEDVLDEFATEALRWKLDRESQTTSTQVWSVIPESLKPSVFLFNDKIESKIEDIMERLDDLAKEGAGLGLKEVAAVGSSSKFVRETTSLVHESQVYGRAEDKKKIVERLLKVENDEFSVIPIVGMGGVGKTTLAQFVYNDTEVKKHFDLMAWVCVSDDFNVNVITGKILESVTDGSCGFDSLDKLQVELKKKLTNKKFLIVLDDVWSENYGYWEMLQAPLRGGAVGSKVIVTTRIRKVAEMMRTVESHFLQQLSEDECWSVFEQHAFKNINVERHSNLVAIGKKIVEKCKGLPLAARTLGGLLRSKQYETEWKSILNSEIWDLTEEESDILPALRLSYYHLPSHLKQCFAYCSIFPKDYEFGKKQTVLLWMAQGFLQRTSEKKMEDWGKEYFEDLESRSFFQPSSHKKSLYVMHDLVNDLALWVAGETCFKLAGGHHTKQYKDSKRVRHSSYVVGEYDGNKKFECFHEFQYLRTFLPFKLSYFRSCFLTRNIPLILLPKLKCLRALSLSGYTMVELPNSIGDLKLLRYLDVSFTSIRRLPESVSSLHNLETLILEGCYQLRKLPEDFGSLINLRHLNNFDVNSLEEMPWQISKLTCLQTLSNFIVGKGSSGSSLGEIMPLSHLQGALCISRLENVVEDGDARKANLIGKQNLHRLSLKWSKNFDDTRNGRIEFEVFNMLRPHITLKELTIECYTGVKFPTWLGDPSFSNMVLLKIENCGKCTSLPPLGQLPLLKDLSIKGMDGVRSVGPEFYGLGCIKPFQSLERLCFENMQAWQEWIPYGVDYDEFPHLRALSISQCPNLQGKLPNLLLSLENISIDGCKQLMVSISNLPMLCELKIKGCKIEEEEFMQGIGRAKYLEIDNCEKFTSLGQNKMGTLQQSTSSAHLAKHGCTHSNSSTTSEHEEHQQLRVPCRLEILKLGNCYSLEKLPQALHGLTSLGKLNIVMCPRLISFSDVGLPSMLRELIVEDCHSLNSIHEVIMREKTAFLESLEIFRCHSLKFIVQGQLPPTLKRLTITNCEKLQYVVDEGEGSSLNTNASLLEYLEIGYCPLLKFFSSRSRGDLPAMLKTLEISNWSELTSLSLHAPLKSLHIKFCEKLELIIGDKLDDNYSLENLHIMGCEKLKSLPEGLHNFDHLNKMQLSFCSSLVSFPNGGFLPTNLRELLIISCEKLEALPNRMYNLTSLQKLLINQCPDIVSCPEEGFPTSLTELIISDLNICKLVLEWGLHKLTSLTHLCILCLDWVSFPQEEGDGEMKNMMMLPTSLTHLTIGLFPNLEFLSSKGFQDLTTLEYLYFHNCPKLTSLPQKGLPPSLLTLKINNCPLLKERFKKDIGQDWFKIAHIPCLKIDNKSFVYDPDNEQ